MAATNSRMLPLGTKLPSFELPDTVSGALVSSESLAGRVSVVAFVCNHCPYVKHIRAGLAEFGRFAADHGVGLVAISSNDVVAYPADAPDAMRTEAADAGYVFPYLFDESQDVARAFQAACTPDFFVFDASGALAYRGQFDDSRPSNGLPVTGASLREAVTALVAGRPPAGEQRPSIGCNIKWRGGVAPSYAS